ncbi:MAG TPA: tRNA uridine-5-carboxymethylaminomethyl(34) synthesis GTPase MnmE, partial [Xanthobacteraceae bacterium]|nr:tRNA uridine-5-carboxymethylaminomethyl(34) synthesis GTPase MnmE [Xanthobacteraceae bacterium]
ADADLVLWVADPENRPEGLSRDADSPARKAMTFWLIENKCDLVDGGKYRAGEPDLGSPVQRCFTVSAKTGAGLERLLAALTEQARSSLHDVEPALVTRERHRIALSQTVAALDRAIEEAGTGQEELVAEELRLAARALGRLTGRVDVEDILDVVFRDFCIGK